jgi:hypothetical protein
LTEWIDKKIVQAKSILIEKTIISYEEENSAVSNIALADVILLLTYMYKNSYDISKKTKTLDKQLIDVIEY